MVRNLTDIVNSELEGKVRHYAFRKNPTQTTASGYWFDLSMSPGTPPPKYWFDSSPLSSVQVKQSTDGGLFHGANVTPDRKYLRMISLMTSTSTALPMSLKLLDYLVYYPTVDDSITDPQTMTNNFQTLSTFTTPTPPAYQDNTLTLTTNNLMPYTRCRVSTTGTLPGGLAVDTDYWSIQISDTTCRLAASRANAVAGTHIIITDSGSGTHYLKTILPRYTDGAGVQMLPISIGARTGGFTFYVTYTNSSGVAGRISQTVMQNPGATVGVIATSHPAATGNYAGVFIPLQEGDTGVQSVESVTMLTGDVGLMSMVLVQPLAETELKEITAPHEKDFFIESNKLPEIKDDAFLSFICLPVGSLAATGLIGSIKVIWG
jgi:hypothetical protein